MSIYPGNSTLSAVVKDRVSSTFAQSLELYRQGKTDEAASGCELILQMDPAFDPARKLLDKATNPFSMVDLDSLSQAAPGGADDAMQQARAAMVARDFQRVVQLTTEVLTNDLMNDEARVLSDQAREKLEAAPFVDQFFRKFDEHIASGNMTAARTDLEKARTIDSDHPSIVRMERMLSVQQDSGPAAPAAPAPGGFSFDAGPSFVVDTPAPQRGAAQASDFGFTFEEEKAPPAPAVGGFTFEEPAAAAPASSGFGGFSFGSDPAPAAPVAPAPAPPASDAPFAGGFSFDAPSSGGGFSFDSGSPASAPSAGGFEFPTAPVEPGSDDQKKIAQYLADGDRAFENADFQQAIDHWSRIFLIDVTNDVASERIEQAKAKRRAIEQRIEPMLNAGIAAFERRDMENARTKFREVLLNDPSNSSAQSFLDRIDAAGDAHEESPEVFAPPADTESDSSFFDDDMASPGGAPLMPQEAAPAPATPAKKTAAAKTASTKKSLPLGLIGAVAGALVLLVGGWFAWHRMSAPAYDPTATQAILRQAQDLSQKGKYDQAILILQDVKPDDPQHDKALNMIADLQHKKTQAAEMIDGRPAAVVFQESLANGKTLFEAHDYDGAKKQFEVAMRVRALPPDMKASYDAAAQQVAKLDAAKALFAERRFQDAISNLQPLAQADPQNKNIQRMLTDAHFNLGATSLQEEKLSEAVREFDEVLKVEPNDELARRSRELANRYNSQPKDLLYKIYVKYLPLRHAA